jgi:hypothetical protein
MRVPSDLRNLARANKKAARMNEMQQVVDHGPRSTEQHPHRDTESLVERAWQNEPTELHIGFRAQ